MLALLQIMETVLRSGKARVHQASESLPSTPHQHTEKRGRPEAQCLLLQLPDELIERTLLCNASVPVLCALACTHPRLKQFCEVRQCVAECRGRGGGSKALAIAFPHAGHPPLA